MEKHKTVLLEEAIDYLNIKEDGNYIDATLGYAGHSSAILKRLKKGIKNKVSYLDCLINELQGSVNSAFVDGDITEEQCDYFYRKNIYGGLL